MWCAGRWPPARRNGGCGKRGRPGPGPPGTARTRRVIRRATQNSGNRNRAPRSRRIPSDGSGADAGGRCAVLARPWSWRRPGLCPVRCCSPEYSSGSELYDRHGSRDPSATVAVPRTRPRCGRCSAGESQYASGAGNGPVGGGTLVMIGCLRRDGPGPGGRVEATQALRHSAAP
jgi:hypothetical protein